MASKTNGYSLFPAAWGDTQKNPARFRSLYDGVVAKIFDRLPGECEGDNDVEDSTVIAGGPP